MTQRRQVTTIGQLERLVDQLWQATMPTTADRTAVICGMVGYGMLLLGAQAELEEAGVRPYRALADHPTPPMPYCVAYVGAAMARPHLAPHLPTIAGWADQPDEGTIRAMRQLAEVLDPVDLAALASLEHPPPIAGPDLLGAVYTQLLSTHARRGRGTFYTPWNLAHMMGTMTSPAEGQSVCDPAVGSGVLLLGAAQAMREQGQDPTTCTWTGIDIDPIACALFAVNAVVYDLGVNVRVVCGDALAMQPPAGAGVVVDPAPQTLDGLVLPAPTGRRSRPPAARPAPQPAGGGTAAQPSLFDDLQEEDP